jgi:hypothetical protein
MAGVIRHLATCGLAAALATTAAACAPQLQTVELVNRTSRAIDEVYVYPSGAANHGASRGALAPNASEKVQVKPGHVEVLAVSAKVQIDEHTRDQPSAGKQFELAKPTKVVFYDQDQQPAEVNHPGVVGIAFVLLHPRSSPDDADAPAPDASAPAAPAPDTSAPAAPAPDTPAP